MVFDHAAVILMDRFGFFPGPAGMWMWWAMRLFGRMAFPLFAFLIVEGFLHTGNWKRYAIRLGVLAAVSEIPYNLMAGGSLLYPENQNTVWTLLFGLLAVKALETVAVRSTASVKNGAETLTKAGIAFVFPLAAGFLRLDYGFMGVLFIILLYQFRYQPPLRMALGCAALFGGNFDIGGLVSWIAFFFINRYNGKKGRNFGQYAYAFYPLHILTLYGLGELLNGIHF